MELQSGNGIGAGDPDEFARVVIDFPALLRLSFSQDSSGIVIMLRTAAVIALVASALTAAGSPVAAQDATPFERGRLDAARQHMNSVCRPLEAQRQYDKAYRCYSNVTRFLDNPALASIEPLPARPARVAASRADYPVAVVPFRPQRPASGLLASNHILIGVGF